MTKGLAVWLLGFGVFLFVCGAAAFLLNPNQAPTPLLAGTLAGGLMAMMGVFSGNGAKWVPKVGLMVTIVFMMLALAMSMQQWMLVISGKPEIVSALLATVLFGGTGVMLWALKTKA